MHDEDDNGESTSKRSKSEHGKTRVSKTSTNLNLRGESYVKIAVFCVAWLRELILITKKYVVLTL